MKQTFLTALILAGLASPFLSAAEPVAKPVTKTINVFDLIKNGKVDYFIDQNTGEPDPAEEIFVLKDGELQITGHGFGYLATQESFRDYKLVLEFKWSGKTWGPREKAARDNGILLHSYGPHGAFGGTWMTSIEAQIIEGGMGDILVLSADLPDGTALKTSLESEFVLNPKGEKIWKKGAPRTVVENGRVNWEKRDVEWKDIVDWRAKEDPDAPIGEWNTLEVIARGKDLQYFFNGKLVNEAFNAQPSEGKICIQTEGAEMIVRRYELQPLDQPAAK